jgi:hypothetical protein
VRVRYVYLQCALVLAVALKGPSGLEQVANRSTMGQAEAGWPLGHEEVVDSRFGAENDDAATKTFIFSHLPKAGGMTVRVNLWKAINPWSEVRYNSEFSPWSPADSGAFKLAMIRNPCEYYVSIWSFISSYALKGSPTYGWKMDRDVWAATESRDSAEDIRRFRSWLRAAHKSRAHDDPAEGPGILSSRVVLQYSDDGWDLKRVLPHANLEPVTAGTSEKISDALNRFSPSSVACWVKTENMNEDLKHCLREYEAKFGPHVNWDVVTRRLQSDYNGNPSKHGKCQNYYDAESEAFVRKVDHHIFQKFGYPSCCEA